MTSPRTTLLQENSICKNIVRSNVWKTRIETNARAAVPERGPGHFA